MLRKLSWQSWVSIGIVAALVGGACAAFPSPANALPVRDVTKYMLDDWNLNLNIPFLDLLYSELYAESRDETGRLDIDDMDEEDVLLLFLLGRARRMKVLSGVDKLTFTYWSDRYLESIPPEEWPLYARLFEYFEGQAPTPDDGEPVELEDLQGLHRMILNAIQRRSDRLPRYRLATPVPPTPTAPPEPTPEPSPSPVENAVNKASYEKPSAASFEPGVWVNELNLSALQADVMVTDNYAPAAAPQNAEPVPEPVTLLLLGGALGAMALRRKLRR